MAGKSTERKKLTDAIVARFIKEATERGRKEMLWDSEVPGFHVRVSTTGRANYYLFYRTNEGIQRMPSLGLVSDWPTVATARNKAAAMRRAVLDGKDPMQEKHDARSAPDVNELADTYQKEVLPTLAKSTAYDYRLMIAKDIRPQLGTKKVRSLAYSDVQALHQAVIKRGSRRRADSTIMALSSMISKVAIPRKWVEGNVTKQVQRTPTTNRERYLSDTELGSLNKALDNHPDKQAANAIRLLLWTGARRGEVLGMRWDQIDFKSGHWHKLARDTKQRKSHRVPLPVDAQKLLVAIHAQAEREAKKKRRTLSPYVFPSTGKTGHRVNLKSDWKEICLAANIVTVTKGKDAKGKPITIRTPSARLHDLRHSYASVLVNAGISLPMVGKLLGHSNVGTTSRYAHLNPDVLKPLAEQAVAALTGKPSAQVVPFQPQKGSR